MIYRFQVSLFQFWCFSRFETLLFWNSLKHKVQIVFSTICVHKSTSGYDKVSIQQYLRNCVKKLNSWNLFRDFPDASLRNKCTQPMKSIIQKTEQSYERIAIGINKCVLGWNWFKWLTPIFTFTPEITSLVCLQSTLGITAFKAYLCCLTSEYVLIKSYELVETTINWSVVNVVEYNTFLTIQIKDAILF